MALKPNFFNIIEKGMIPKTIGIICQWFICVVKANKIIINSTSKCVV